jgi:uncharacterized SAM-binding protein YcdF (DUF218 family)
VDISLQSKTLWIAVSVSVGLVLFLGLVSSILPRSIWNYLVVDEKPKQADVIIVLSQGLDRAQQGVRLYQLGYAPMVIFAGGSLSARAMSEWAMDLGLPAEAVILEEQSITTFTDAQYSLEIMRTQGFKSAIVVTSPEHTRRARAIFRYVFRGLDFTISAAQYDPALASTWWRDRRMVRLVGAEYLKSAWFYLFEKWVPDPQHLLGWM